MTVTARLAELGFQQHPDNAQWWTYRKEGEHRLIIVTAKLDEGFVDPSYHPDDVDRAMEIYRAASTLLRKGT